MLETQTTIITNPKTTKEVKNIKEFIHYGSNTYNPEKLFQAVQTRYERYDKPQGLWASPVDSNFSWYDFCTSENFKKDSLKESFKFTIHPNARILYINKLEDAKKYMYVKETFHSLTIWALNLKLMVRWYASLYVQRLRTPS